MNIKQLLLLTFSILFVGFINAQSQIIKLDSENGSFKNFPVLPDNEVFIIEGEIDKSITLVEIIVKEEKSGRNPVTYSWNRSIHNNSENFEVIITQPLKSGSSYDFTIITYTLLDIGAKRNLLANILTRSQHMIKSQVVIDKNTIKVDKAKELIKGLNEIVQGGIELQRSRNGITFNGLSRLVESEIERLNKFKLKNLIRRKKGTEKDSITNKALNTKVDYLTELILTEIRPFISSELVQQYRKYEVNNVSTKKDKFTLPINGGLYAWNFTSNINNVNFSNTGITPGVGITIPFKRRISVKGRSLPSFGISVGVLTNQLKDSKGDRYGTPTIKLPIYGAIGVNFFRVIRVNAGTLLVSNFDSSPNKLQFIPTVGIALELDAWLGVRR
jgi:hypothetical protein